MAIWISRAFAGSLALAAGNAGAQTVVLHENGPIVTAPAGAVDGAGLSAVQTTLGLMVTGHGAAHAHGQRLADDFVVPPAGWRIAAFAIDAFQAGASRTAPPFDRVYLRIWSGVPGAFGSNVVFEAPVDGLPTTVAFADAYRVTGLGTDLERPLFTLTASVGTLVLAPGSYWADFQISTLRDGGTWVPPVTVAGQVHAGNALQFAGDGWWALRDGGTHQDLRFRVIGREGDAGAPVTSIFMDGFED